MSQLAELFVDRAAAAIMEARGRWWATAPTVARDRCRDEARAALDSIGLSRGSESIVEAAVFMLEDERAIKAAAGRMPAVEVVTAVLWLLISLSDRNVDVAELLEWARNAIAAGAGDLRALAEILEER